MPATDEVLDLQHLIRDECENDEHGNLSLDSRESSCRDSLG